MYKVFLTLSLFTTSLAYCSYDEVKDQITQKLQMYEDLRVQETSLYGQWYLQGVKVGLENALFILYTEEQKLKADEDF